MHLLTPRTLIESWPITIISDLNQKTQEPLSVLANRHTADPFAAVEPSGDTFRFLEYTNLVGVLGRVKFLLEGCKDINDPNEVDLFLVFTGKNVTGVLQIAQIADVTHLKLLGGGKNLLGLWCGTRP